MPDPLPTIRRGAEPFWLAGGEVGCLCVHGFTASPEEMRWMGEHLHAQGYTVYGPRLSGHGTAPIHMARQRWQDWYEDVISGLALLRTQCRTVYAVGLSMGGLLSLRAAAEGLVDGAAILASPVELDVPLLRWTPLLKYAIRFTREHPSELDARVREVQRAAGRDDYGRVAYPNMPVAAIQQLGALMTEVRAHLPRVTVPLLLVYSRADRTVPFRNLALVRDTVGSADITTHILERSGHVLTQDVEHETVFELVGDWLAGRTAPGAAADPVARHAATSGRNGTGQGAPS